MVELYAVPDKMELHTYKVRVVVEYTFESVQFDKSRAEEDGERFATDMKAWGRLCDVGVNVENVEIA